MTCRSTGATWIHSRTRLLGSQYSNRLWASSVLCRFSSIAYIRLIHHTMLGMPRFYTSVYTPFQESTGVGPTALAKCRCYIGNQPHLPAPPFLFKLSTNKSLKLTLEQRSLPHLLLQVGWSLMRGSRKSRATHCTRLQLAVSLSP